MKKLILLVGPPGSGKTTMAMNMDNFCRINQDSQGKKFHMDIFNQCIQDELNIVIDRMGFNKSQRDRYLIPAKKAGYYTTIIVLHENYKTCFDRCMKRENHETIKDEINARSALETFFTKYERVEDYEADEVIRHWPKVIKPVIISDLDGTLCNIDHRLHHVQNGKKRWDLFFKEIPEDKLNLWCSDILFGLNRTTQNALVFSSGRSEQSREVTEKWLKQYGFNYHQYLFMRPLKDSRKDSIVKEIMLEFEIKTRYIPYLVIDDRKQVVDMWRKHGITCLQCAEGNF